MRLFLSAVLAALLLSGTAFAAEDDEILSDLIVVTATSRPADVKMVVQTVRPAPSSDKQAKVAAPAENTPQPVETASK